MKELSFNEMEKTCKRIIVNDNLIMDNDIPVLQLDMMMEDGTIQEGVGFLTPFRGYAFQVSMTAEGQCDMGSTEVIGLGNITDMQESDKDGWQYRSNVSNEGRIREIIRWGMCAAIIQFCSKKDCVPPSMVQLDYHREKSIAKFIDATIAFVSK